MTQICKGSGELSQACHLLRMNQVPADEWNTKEVRGAFLRQMWEREGHAGYPDEFYAAKETFQADAAPCFNRHHRPQGYCIDWESDSVRLTDEPWQPRYHDSQKRLLDVGLTPPQGMERKHLYLCQFCPVASFV